MNLRFRLRIPDLKIQLKKRFTLRFDFFLYQVFDFFYPQYLPVYLFLIILAMWIEDYLFLPNKRGFLAFFLARHHFEGPVVPHRSHRVVVELRPVKRRVHHRFCSVSVPSRHYLLRDVCRRVPKSTQLCFLNHVITQIRFLFERLQLGGLSWSVWNQFFRFIQRKHLCPIPRVVLIERWPCRKSVTFIDNNEAWLTFMRIEDHLAPSVFILSNDIFIALIIQLFRDSNRINIRLRVLLIRPLTKLTWVLGPSKINSPIVSLIETGIKFLFVISYLFFLNSWLALRCWFSPGISLILGCPRLLLTVVWDVKILVNVQRNIHVFLASQWFWRRRPLRRFVEGIWNWVERRWVLVLCWLRKSCQFVVLVRAIWLKVLTLVIKV